MVICSVSNELFNVLVSSIDEIFIGIAVGVVIGTLLGTNRILLKIWSTLMDIEREIKKKDKGF